jgi:predicted transcriptional regulator
MSKLALPHNTTELSRVTNMSVNTLKNYLASLNAYGNIKDKKRPNQSNMTLPKKVMNLLSDSKNQNLEKL